MHVLAGIRTEDGPSAKRWVALGIVMMLVLAVAKGAAAAPDVLRIGYQKSSSLFIILKGQGALEKALAPLGVTVSWHEFSSGLPLLEGVNVGSIDLTADVADTVPLFAQAAGAHLTYLAQETPSPAAQAILVAKDSPITSVADLRGRKIGLAKAAGVHYLTLRALEMAGLHLNDVQIADLQPADGRVAFESGAIDAWAIWDPFLAAVETRSGARVLVDGTQTGVSYRRFYLVSTAYAQSRPEVLKTVVAELRQVGLWIKQQPDAAARVQAGLIGLDSGTVAQANSRRSYVVAPVDEAAWAEQQKIADAFTAAKLLPVALDVRASAAWHETP
ncbi:MAG: aliphatic sulfonate ABC transporter substrate-binding protein [Azospirillaceae bacterium]|nr:aliphatic sulfonate ABC transporter substrate-binding protein [Azospirillaceae bacterium]